MNFKKLALVSLASAAVLGAAQTAVHADDANTNTTATSDAVKAAQAKVNAAQTKADAAQAQLTKATTNVATAQATVDSETAGLEQAQKDLQGQPADLVSGELNRRTKLVQDAKDDLAAAQTLQAQAQQAADAAQAELVAAQEELAAAQKAAEKPAEETATVKVRVADLDGNPVAGATVEFLVGNAGTQVETGKDGYATFTAKKGTEVTARLSKYDEANYTYVFENKELVADDSANNNVALIELTKKPSTTPVTPAKPAEKSDLEKAQDKVKELEEQLKDAQENGAEDYYVSGLQDALDKAKAEVEALTPKTPAETTTAPVTVTVQDQDGNAVAGATVEVYGESGVQPTTDARGQVTVDSKIGEETLVTLVNLPEGYELVKQSDGDKVNLGTLTKDGASYVYVVKKVATDNKPAEPTPAKDASLTITVVSDGQAREGVAVDVMVNGKPESYTTDKDGKVVVNAKEGDKVDYRVATVPAGYEAPAAASSTLKAGDNAAQITVNKAGSTDNKTPETPAAKDATLLITVVSEGKAQEGVAVDVMVNGKAVNVGTTDAKGQVIVHAKEGDKVDYRVATVPAGYEAPAAASSTLKAGENAAQITVNKAGSTTPTDNKPVEPTKPETPAAKDATLLITVVSDGQAREGVAVDVMVNGKVVNVGTTDAKGQVIVHAKEGDKVDYRVATVPAGYEAPAAASSTLKAGENAAQITVNKAGSTTPTPEPTPTPNPTEEATFTLSVVDAASKAPLSGVAIDLMVAGKVTTATTDANGQVTVSAKAGDVVKYRVAVTPAGYKSNTVAYDATLVKGANSATLALAAEGTTPTPQPQPQPEPQPEPTPTPKDDENTTNTRYGFAAYEDVNKDGKFYDRFRNPQTYEDIFGNYNYSYVMAMGNKNNK